MLARLITRYGVKALFVLQLMNQDRVLAGPVCPHHEVTYAEIIHALRNEFACTLTDVLARRTRIAWSSCQGLDALSMMTSLARRYAGWSQEEAEHQVEQYRDSLAEGLAFRRSRARAGSTVPG
jgi:glycerol-3-phosphate dehydrogenase